MNKPPQPQHIKQQQRDPIIAKTIETVLGLELELGLLKSF